MKTRSKKYKLEVKKPSLLTLIALISYGSIGAALFTPAITTIMEIFQLSSGVAQLVITIFLVGYSLGQLIYSPLAKRYGRKPALYIGISISLIGSALCALSGPLHSFSLLIFGRFIAALGSSAGLSLTFMIISDFYYEKDARKITAIAMLAFAVVPGVSIALGGFIVAFLGWESCFYFLILYGLFVLYLVLRLAETSSGRELEATRFTNLIRSYKRDFKNRKLLLYSFMIGATTAIIYIFAVTAPIIAIGMMGLTPDIFGLYSLIPAAGYFLGNILAASLVSRYEIQAVLKQGIALIGLGVLILFVIFYGGWAAPLTLFLPIFIIYLGIPLFYSNAAVLATYRTPDKLNASSIMSFINIGTAVLGVGVIGLLQMNPIYTMPALFVGLVLLVFSLFKVSEKII
ncbi:MAG: Inner membrane transport protein YdhC [Chlamydiae bacterium]|nr:Inner membrane transport protein YdhC [Chlamydiota bacterium]